MREELRGKDVVLTTTNGTKALNIAKDADTVVVGSLLNLHRLSSAVSGPVRSDQAFRFQLPPLIIVLTVLAS